jgi:hypothetical protein
MLSIKTISKIFGFTIFNAFVKSVRAGRWTNGNYIHVVPE